GGCALELVEGGSARRGASWTGPEPEACEAVLDEILGRDRVAALDRFERVQLTEVVAVCRAARSLSDAGRTLFAASRTRKKAANDADRLRKYLARYGLQWDDVARRA